MSTMTRIPDEELAAICERNCYPSVGENLAAGQTQEQATQYIAGRPPEYDDDEGRWLAEYVTWLHRQL